MLNISDVFGNTESTFLNLNRMLDGLQIDVCHVVTDDNI